MAERRRRRLPGEPMAGRVQPHPVLLDTDVFSTLLLRADTALTPGTVLQRDTWRRRLQGRVVVIAAYAELTAWARFNGHGLHNRVHTADRWIAASAQASQLVRLLPES